MCIYIYIYIERERESTIFAYAREMNRMWWKNEIVPTKFVISISSLRGGQVLPNYKIYVIKSSVHVFHPHLNLHRNKIYIYVCTCKIFFSLFFVGPKRVKSKYFKMNRPTKRFISFWKLFI